MNGWLEDDEQDQYKRLMKYLKQLRKEGAEITGWLPGYEMVNGKPTGRFWITVNGKEKLYKAKEQ